MTAPRDGFTLIEVLVVLAVCGLLLVTLTQGAMVCLTAWRIDQQQSTSVSDLAALELTLRHLIEAADPGSDDEAGPPLQGRSGVLMLVTRLHGTGVGTPTALAQVSLLVDARHRLVLRWRPRTPYGRNDPAPAPAETILLDGVSRIDLAFWQAGQGWVSAWRSFRLPAMIRIHLALIARHAPNWPDIVAAPAVVRQ